MIEKGKYSIIVYEETDCMDFADHAKTISESSEKQNELNLRLLSNRNHVYDTVHSQIFIFDNSIDILKIVRRKKLIRLMSKGEKGYPMIWIYYKILIL